ncbi:DUF2797 domain-containing protein [Sunxiuqinia indica]|uniref:DUF2797 domain-containing protein n=1 Tax=Sunxiuqinia indica TaxID=2692584 RepID=UPI0013598AA9|nr:DUF2797 domain-containing protein [Sunxiuqinia indica]
MEYQGNILKMRTELDDPIQYQLPIGDELVNMNALIGQLIQFNFDGQINCISCGKKTKTSFSQGFCYNCYQTVPEAGADIMRPELSRAQYGVARDIKWAEEHDLIDHYVYLAVSSELKVGVTRHHQVPTRWIDQGASRAIRLAKTPNRHIAGIIEVLLKKHFTDKTNWRAMLQNQLDESIKLDEEKQKALKLIPAELQQYFSDENEILELHYPVTAYPEKVKSITFDKQAEIVGKLMGIKGQYLIFDKNQVLNIRKHNGYFLRLAVNS